MSKRKKESFTKEVAKGAAKGVAEFYAAAAGAVVTELFSILTLGIYKPPKR